jgi:hypothetical protein
LQDVQEIFGRYVLVEQLDGVGIESWLGVGLALRDADAHVVVRRVSLWTEGRDDLRKTLQWEAEMRGLAADRSLPRLVDHGEVGQIPFLAYAYVPGVTLQEVLRATETREAPLLSSSSVIVVGACLCNAVTALTGQDESVFNQCDFHPAGVVLPWEGIPVLLGPGQGGPPSRSGLYGLANLLFSLLTGHRALVAGEPVPALSTLAPNAPRELTDILKACLEGYLMERDLARVSNALHSLTEREADGTAHELMEYARIHFGARQRAWEARRLVHERLRRRMRREATPGRPQTAQVVHVQFPRRPGAPHTSPSALAPGRPASEPVPFSLDELFDDVKEDPTWFLHQDTGDTDVEPVQEIPVQVQVESERGVPEEAGPPPDQAPGAVRSLPERTREGGLMVWVPRGVFTCGSDGRIVHLDHFFVDRFPVTNAAYARFVGETGHPPPPHWPDHRMPRDLAHHPVVLVTHADVQAYATWAGKALPTEEQWEKGARGAHGWLWPHGPEFNRARVHDAWQYPERDRRTAAVGMLSPPGDSPYGVADIGMVWEWTATPWKGSSGHVVRGGPWRSRREPPCVVNRWCELTRAADVGFRCVATPEAFQAIQDPDP